MAQPPTGRSLEIGESATVPVRARLKWNVTDLRLTTGCRYDFLAEGTWIDLMIKSDADGFPSPFRIMSSKESRRRSPEHDWFRLIGAVDYDLASRFALGVDHSLTIGSSGLFMAFANDLRNMYWNNFGALKLTVTRHS